MSHFGGPSVESAWNVGNPGGAMVQVTEENYTNINNRDNAKS